MAYDDYGRDRWGGRRDQRDDGRENGGGDRDYRGAGELGGYEQSYGGQGYGQSDYKQRDGAGQRYGQGERSYGGYGQERFGGGSDYYRGSDGDRQGYGQDRGYGQRGGDNRIQGQDTYRQSRGTYDRQPQRHDSGRGGDRGFVQRAEDEVRSWFGDGDAERRREQDAREWERGSDRPSGARDEHYHSWRDQQIASFDRDYHEYRQENQSKFHNEFAAFRTERQGQRDLLGKVEEHQEVVGSDGSHVGTVDKVRGDRIILTKSDPDAGGHHHSIPSRWLQSADGGKLTLRKTAEEAKAHWRDEERQGSDRGAMFGGDNRSNESGEGTSGTNLNRSFSGTY